MKAKLVLFLSSILASCILILVAEMIVRVVFPSINFQGTDRRLVRDNAFGSTFGWQPDATGISFGVPVSIGSDGFRVHSTAKDDKAALLLIGDSVIFGVGVEADSTIAGIFQRHLPDRHVINAGCVGYGVRHYKDVSSHVLQSNQAVHTAVLFFSLNDIYPAEPLAVSAVPWLAFLRNNSKLYLLLKGLLLDRSQMYFEHDYGLYTDRPAMVDSALVLLTETVRAMELKGVTCIVVMIPYEYQIRVKDDHLRLPQRIVEDRLVASGIRVVDLYETFTSEDTPSRDFFLFGDHMHLSALGHRTVATALLEYL